MNGALSIGLVGAGAVANAVADRWSAAGHRIAQVWSRRPDRAQALAVQHHAEFLIRPVAFDAKLDAVLLAVSDDAIDAVATELGAHASPHTLYLHASGATPLEVLAPLGTNVGVCWPIQGFTTGHDSEWVGVPVLTEGGGVYTDRLNKLAHALSNHVTPVTGSERQRVHLAATLANNFATALIAEAGELIAPLGLDHHLFLPSLQTLLSRLWLHAPATVQTGPARRGDQRSLEAHRALLAQHAPELMPVYEALSVRIAERARLTASAHS